MVLRSETAAAVAELEEQRKHLDLVISWAERARSLADLWRPTEQHLHLRPSSTGIRLIDLRLDRPQLDRGEIRNANTVRATFSKRLVTAFDDPPGCPTPEAHLQSWLIADAYRHNRVMIQLSSDLRFVTDELQMPGTPGLTCDLLAVRTTPKGVVPVLVELKTQRLKKELLRQLTFADRVNANATRFAHLFAACLGEPIEFQGPCEKWVVWPAAGSHARDPREKELAAQNIRVVGYVRTGESYHFRIGREPCPVASAV